MRDEKNHAKDEVYWQILNAALRLDATKGHLKWSISDVARLSKVSRALIYYYFGKSKPAIINEAMKIIGDEFFGLTSDRLALWKEGRIVDSILKTRRLLDQAPHLVPFYLNWRNNPSPIQDHLLELEERYSHKLREAFPYLTSEAVTAVFGIVFGLVATPGLTEDVIAATAESAFAVVQRDWNRPA